VINENKTIALSNRLYISEVENEIEQKVLESAKALSKNV